MEVLRTERLRLRWFELEDAAFMLGLLNEPAWIQHIYDPQVRDLDQARQWIAERLLPRYWRQGHGFWAVERLSDGETLGLCGVIHREGLDHPDLGYGFPARHWGQGYAREAARGCLHYVHEVLGMHHVLGTTAPDNEASGRVLLDLGFTDLGLQQTAAHEGLSRVYDWQRPAPSDAQQIAALHARWRAALSGAHLAALPACLLPDALLDPQDLTPARLQALATQWAQLADAPPPAQHSTAGWRLALPYA